MLGYIHAWKGSKGFALLNDTLDDELGDFRAVDRFYFLELKARYPVSRRLVAY